MPRFSSWVNTRTSSPHSEAISASTLGVASLEASSTMTSSRAQGTEASITIPTISRSVRASSYTGMMMESTMGAAAGLGAGKAPSSMESGDRQYHSTRCRMGPFT